MLVFVTSRGHSFPVHTLVNNRLGEATPPCRVVSYDDLFTTNQTVNGVHIFTGIDQLYDWEVVLAADLCRALKAKGIVCLNDPARVMSRFELLRNLHEEGINPFNAYRADARPKPARFPVFIRREFDHRGPVTDLIHDQAELDRVLAGIRADGRTLRGLLVIEYAAEPIAPGIWRKLGTARIGGAYHILGHVVQDHWAAKHGKLGLATDPMYEEERAIVAANQPPEVVKRAFELSGIEWGRADHATVDGREVIYEINTNPWIYRVRNMGADVRQETMAIARERFARLLWQTDAGDGSPVLFEPSDRLVGYRNMNSDAISPIRP
ncbi:hypothetical protein [Bauldia litoralis]|uniref:Glutathione synthase/RimK-type ligase, ATP-grasp superfamily n=1 Tax=Bauldia litoralis TaxID=665467 RepID=A0A1G6D6V3_9HYPH|nr:hypothetical protein [Bauldia litoralis]SDB40645.1 hypothetical protein SAMN02982931_03071 [Bauldia litoralis]